MDNKEKVSNSEKLFMRKPCYMNYEIPVSVQFLYLSFAARMSAADWLCQKHYPGHLEKQILGLPGEVQAACPQWASKGNS